jgi:hypothetical protein
VAIWKVAVEADLESPKEDLSNGSPIVGSERQWWLVAEAVVVEQ